MSRVPWFCLNHRGWRNMLMYFFLIASWSVRGQLLMWLKTLGCFKSYAVHPWSQLGQFCVCLNSVWQGLDPSQCQCAGSRAVSILLSVQTCGHTGREKADPWKWALQSWLRPFPTLFQRYLPTAGQLLVQESWAAPACLSCVGQHHLPCPGLKRALAFPGCCAKTRSGVHFSREPAFPRSPLTAGWMFRARLPGREKL